MILKRTGASTHRRLRWDERFLGMAGAKVPPAGRGDGRLPLRAFPSTRTNAPRSDTDAQLTGGVVPDVVVPRTMANVLLAGSGGDPELAAAVVAPGRP